MEDGTGEAVSLCVKDGRLCGHWSYKLSPDFESDTVLIILIWMNTASVLGNSNDLNELPGVQYVLIEKHQMSGLIFLYSPFNIPTKFYTSENPLGQKPKDILPYELKIIFQVSQ